MVKNPKQLVTQGYDQVAQTYARLEQETEWPRMRWLNKLLKQLPPGSTVLDLGCGSGVPADAEIAQTHQVTGVDISPVQIELARQNIPSGQFMCADVGSLHFPASSFHAVVSFYALEHLPREEHAALIQRIYTWLHPQGWLLLGTEPGDEEGVVGEWLGVPMYFSCFDAETVKGFIIQNGFEIVETAVEAQTERDHEVHYLWVLAQKP